MRIVTLEEHFNLPEFIKRIPEEVITERGWPNEQNASPMMEKAQALLPEFGEERLSSMDKSGISVDYPFSPNEKGKVFLDSLDLPQQDLEKLAHGNADKLLKLKV